MLSAAAVAIALEYLLEKPRVIAVSGILLGALVAETAALLSPGGASATNTAEP